MKKFICLLFILVSLFVFIPSINALSINDYKKDLADLEKKKKYIEENQAKIDAEIADIEEQIRQITVDMVKATKEQKEKEKEIDELNIQISDKEQEIKDLVVFYQASNSENFYLKYIFGAESFTDFIYRFSVIEQLTTRNDELVDEMNGLISKNEKKIVELENKKVELNNMEAQVKSRMSKLYENKSDYAEEGADYDEQIKAVKRQIKTYRDLGCRDNEDLAYCVSTAPVDSSYIRPVKHGGITDNYGPRESPCYGCSTFHKGIDIGTSEGTSVMAVAAGKVVDIDRYSCGGRVVTLNHIVNGQYVTTRYMHLWKIKVEVGDIVAQGQVIATSGGGSNAPDDCSTGGHLHFETVEGHYFGSAKGYSYSSYSTYLSKTFDPRKVIWFPAYGVWW